MDDETQKIIAEQIKKLPADVRAAIASMDYQTKMQEVTNRQKLLIDQAGKLELETTLVMIGLEPLADYIGNLQRELNVSEIQAKEIAMDVNDNIFKPIRNSLQAMSISLQNEDEKETDSWNTDANAEEVEPPVTKFTNTNETTLNRDQILKEIENPAIIEKGDQYMEFPKSKPVSTIDNNHESFPRETNASTQVEIRPKQELETIPGMRVIDKPIDVLKDKMTTPTIISKQVVDVKLESKLPEVNKNRPTSGIDPYREAIS